MEESLCLFAKYAQLPDGDQLAFDLDLTKGQVRKVKPENKDALVASFRRSKPESLILTVWFEQGVRAVCF